MKNEHILLNSKSSLQNSAEISGFYLDVTDCYCVNGHHGLTVRSR